MMIILIVIRQSRVPRYRLRHLENSDLLHNFLAWRTVQMVFRNAGAKYLAESEFGPPWRPLPSVL